MSKRMLDIPVLFKVKAAADDDNLIIEGYANTTDKDRQGDVILEEAWTKGGLDNYTKNPIILAYHKHDEPIGKMIDYSVNNKGFRIVAEISKAAGKIFSLIQSEVLKTFSVGFRVKDADYDQETDIFVIKDLELMEVSVVSVPANADSTFSVRKSFGTEDEYTLFKSEFDEDATTVNAEEASIDDSEINEEKNKMGEEKTRAQIEAEVRATIEKENREAAATKKAIEDEVTSQVSGIKTSTIVEVEVGVERLKSELETRLTDEGKSFAEAIEGMQNEIKEYAEQLTALHASKMQFIDKSTGKDFTDSEKDFAMLVSKMANVPVAQTKWYAGMVEKSDAAHQASMTEDWEAGFQLRLWDDIREKLIVEAMITEFPMMNVTVNLPLNPEAAYGTWVTTAQYAAATSSGTVKIHPLSDTAITAHKLATKELLSYEEEDDSMIAMVPIIRDAAVRRMAKSSDKALLIGDEGDAAGTGEGLYPFTGLAQIGIDDSRNTVIGGTLASPTVVTILNLQAMRRSLGVHGHNPGDVVYVVNHNVYFDLLEDPDFRTVDMVGAAATILTGQVGRIGGSPVVVSGEFATAAASLPAAICVNLANYIKGQYKGLTVERERSVENQTNLLVVTRRFGFLEMFPANTTVATLSNPAS